MGSQSYTTNGTYTFNPPYGVYSVDVQVWGAGGGGGGASNGSAGGGGGGYIRATYLVTNTQSCTVVIGKGGAASVDQTTDSTDGTASSFTANSLTITANPGLHSSTATQGTGGTNSHSGGITPTDTRTGGIGGHRSVNSFITRGGGGGGAAGAGNAGGAGGDATSSAGGAAGVGAGGGGNGGAGDGGSLGTAGVAPGGGGGGNWYDTQVDDGNSGNAGADGKVLITWTVDNAGLLSILL